MARQFTPSIAGYSLLFFSLAYSATTLAQDPQSGATAARNSTRTRSRSTTQRHAPPTAIASLDRPASFALPAVVIYYSRDGAEVADRKASNIEKRNDGIGESITIRYGSKKPVVSELAKTEQRPGRVPKQSSPLNSSRPKSQTSNVIKPSIDTRPADFTSKSGTIAAATPPESQPVTTPEKPADSGTADSKPSETALPEAIVKDEIAKVIPPAGLGSKTDTPVTVDVTAPSQTGRDVGSAVATGSDLKTVVAPKSNPPDETKPATENVSLPNTPTKLTDEHISPTTSDSVAKIDVETSPNSDPKPTTEVIAPPPVAKSTAGTSPATEALAAPPIPNAPAAVGTAKENPVVPTSSREAAAAAPPLTNSPLETKPVTANALDASPSTVPATESKSTSETSSTVISASSNAVALNNSAIQLIRESRFEEASEQLRRAIDAKPDAYKLHRNLSIVYERLNKLDDALKSAEAAMKLAPGEPSAVMQLCSVQLQVQKYSEALHCYENLRKLGPLDTVSQTSYGVALLRSGETRNAIAVLEKVAATVPLTSQTLNALGVAYFDDKRFADAVSAFKKAVEVDPDQHGLRFNLAIAYLSKGNKEGALSQYRILKESDARLAEQLYLILFRDKVVSADQLRSR
ncbi:MAG: hypothetical protein DMF63_00365 [Acidobacteria bacterium]|nr:MAG: hypothetical protein DMF63_00365 [Acidobacteriota bacterium]